MTDRKRNEEMLDNLIGQAKADRHEVPDQLLNRVFADALAAQPAPVGERRQSGRLRRFLSAIGGWPAIAGMAAATLAGVWIGVSPPAGLNDVAEIIFFGATEAEFAFDDTDFSAFAAEG